MPSTRMGLTAAEMAGAGSVQSDHAAACVERCSRGYSKCRGVYVSKSV